MVSRREKMAETHERNQRLLRAGLLLEYVTLAWNVVGVVVLIFAALKAHSVALVAFGLDSVIEIGASTVVIWQLSNADPKRKSLALRLISTAFFALAIYVLIQSSTVLSFQVRPGQSLGGILWLGATVAAMLALAVGKDRTGKKLDNLVLQTEARVTLFDAYLAASVLLGLVLNVAIGWWWADPVAALVIVFYGFTEGTQTWKEANMLSEARAIESKQV
jgi:divalent metal cation (Fe/Co/Zn/Cd) transporter